MFGVIFIFLCLVQFLVVNPCKDIKNIVDRLECPPENLTDWLDNQIVVLKKPQALTADESSDRFYFIDISAIPFFASQSNGIIIEVCVDFSAVDFLSSDSINLEFSSPRDTNNLTYLITNNLIPKNPERIREILKDPPILRLGCYRIISDLFSEETNEIDPTVQLRVKSTKKNSRRFSHYTEFYFKFPNWHKPDEESDDCQLEPFIYVNSTYRNFDKIILKWINCSLTKDLKISKHEENTNKQIWVEHVPEHDMKMPLIFWQVKGNHLSSRFYYKAEIIKTDENDIPVHVTQEPMKKKEKKTTFI